MTKDNRHRKRSPGPVSIPTIDAFWSEIEALIANRFGEDIDPVLDVKVPFSVRSISLDQQGDSAWYLEQRRSDGFGWMSLLALTRDAFELGDEEFVRACFDIADRALQAGPDGEMWEMSYVSYIEDLRLPGRLKVAERMLKLMPETLRENWLNQSPHGWSFQNQRKS